MAVFVVLFFCVFVVCWVWCVCWGVLDVRVQGVVGPGLPWHQLQIYVDPRAPRPPLPYGPCRVSSGEGWGVIGGGGGQRFKDIFLKGWRHPQADNSHKETAGNATAHTDISLCHEELNCKYFQMHRS